MTKRQLVEFLEHKQNETLACAEDTYAAAKANHKLQLEEDIRMNAVAENITMLISQADDTLKEWLRSIEEQPELGIETTNYYGSLLYKLADLLSFNDIKGAMYKNISDQSKEKIALEERYLETKSAINSNYTNVMANVRQLKDAKLGIQYLTDLGFDLTTLLEENKNQMTNALAVPVDVTFLFIADRG